ncbi:MAG TPA: hypothetical protein VFM54_17305 [Micromonosporaceae bacterium]|nr:hypothetical protein [Micromonosporaceae bacterium]
MPLGDDLDSDLDSDLDGAVGHLDVRPQPGVSGGDERIDRVVRSRAEPRPGGGFYVLDT